MVSITIGLFILAGLMGALFVATDSARSNDANSDLVTNGRYALNSMKQELRQAGFRAYTGVFPNGSGWAGPGALGLKPNVCKSAGTPCECLQTGAQSGSFVSNIRQGVWGSNDENPFTGNCIPNGDHAQNTDILAIRRLDPYPQSVLTPGVIYFQSALTEGFVFGGAQTPVSPPIAAGQYTPMAIFKVKAFVYYIKPYSFSKDENPRVPELRRRVLQDNGVMDDELVASGIERMQVQFGSIGKEPMDPFPVGASSDNQATGWDSVNSVRIWLLVRSARMEPGYTNTTSYTLGNQPPFIPNDGFRRQLMSTVVQLRNSKVLP